MHNIDGRLEMSSPAASPSCEFHLVMSVHALVRVEYDDLSSFHVRGHVALPQVTMAEDGLYLPTLGLKDAKKSVETVHTLAVTYLKRW